jgi:hypothetical protein
MPPIFKKGDKVRFYHVDYNVSKVFQLMGMSGLLVEIYNKETNTYWNLEFYPENDKYFRADIADLCCYRSHVFDNMKKFKPVCYYRNYESVFSDLGKSPKIIYKLTSEQAALINAYLKNESYPKYFRWFTRGAKNVSNDWEFFYSIFPGLSIHIEGTAENKLDDFLHNVV